MPFIQELTHILAPLETGLTPVSATSRGGLQSPTPCPDTSSSVSLEEGTLGFQCLATPTSLADASTGSLGSPTYWIPHTQFSLTPCQEEHPATPLSAARSSLGSPWLGTGQMYTTNHGHQVHLDVVTDGEPHTKPPASPALDMW